jgi:molecular chaperone DnaK
MKKAEEYWLFLVVPLLTERLADQESHEPIERKNQADSVVYQAENQLNELGDQVPPAEKNKASRLIKDWKDAIAQDDDSKIKTILPELQQTL